MAEGASIKADQIEGLSELIQAQVQEALRKEARPDLQDVEEVRRSPVGILIRLEEQVKALKSEMEQRFTALKSEMEQRFTALKSEMEQRFTALKLEIDQRFAALEDKMNQRFDSMEKRFTILQWGVGLVFVIQLMIFGKLFLK